jgi:uridine kinase
MVAIAGGSGSGKSTTAAHLPQMLSPLSVQIVSQDDYYKDSRELPGFDAATYNFDTPDARDHDLLADHLKALRAGQDVYVPIYDFTIHGRRVATQHLAVGDVIILEGTHTLCDPRIRQLCDLKIFVDTPDDIRFVRRLLRDIHERGRTPENVVQQYLATVRPAFERWTGPSRLNADVIVSGGSGVQGSNTQTAIDAARQIAMAIRAALTS